jgi:hypothetical protein
MKNITVIEIRYRIAILLWSTVRSHERTVCPADR